MRIGLHLPLENRPRATCAVCLVQQGSAYWAHVGDSRIYLLRHGAVRREPAITAMSNCCCARASSPPIRRTIIPCATMWSAASEAIRFCRT